MATEIFIADFDGNGPGFSGANRPGEALTNAVFGSWSIGGNPILAGRWQLSYNEASNRTGGSGRYASIKSNSSEFMDTHVWMISPLINIRKYENLTLSTDLYLKFNGRAGENTLTVSILTIDNKPPSDDSVGHHTVATIGEHMSAADELLGNNSWPISQFADGSDFIQLAFSWYSSEEPGSVQLDNIKVLGDKKATLAPPSNLNIK